MDIGLSSDGGRALKPGSFRLARISAACRAQRQREAMVSLTSGLAVAGGEGSVMLAFGEEVGELGWRRAIFSW